VAYNRSPSGGASTGGADAEPLYCANHPTVPTFLRCARCEKPICARCRVATPVGYRCVQCANLASLPTYAISSTYYTRAAFAGFALASVVGLLWALLPGFDFWAALALGLGVGEVVSAAANLKRGPGLQIVGIAAALWGILLSRLALAVLLTIPAAAGVIGSIPGNSQAAILRGGGTLFTTIGQHDVVGVFLNLVQHGDLLSLVFILLALGLTFLRLR